MVWNYTKCLYGGKGGGRLHKDLKNIVQDSGQVAGGGGKYNLAPKYYDSDEPPPPAPIHSRLTSAIYTAVAPNF